MNVCSYLDPYSLYCFKITEKYFYKLLSRPIFYKRFCKISLKYPEQSKGLVYDEFHAHIMSTPTYMIGHERKQ